MCHLRYFAFLALELGTGQSGIRTTTLGKFTILRPTGLCQRENLLLLLLLVFLFLGLGLSLNRKGQGQEQAQYHQGRVLHAGKAVMNSSSTSAWNGLL